MVSLDISGRKSASKLHLPFLILIIILLLLFEKENGFGSIKRLAFSIVKREVFGLGGFFPRANKEKYHFEYLGYVGFFCRSFRFSLSDRLSQHRGL